MSKKNLQLAYNIPILESGSVDNEFMIRGIAINTTVTGNNHKFLEEELRSSAASLKDVPLLIDHRNEIDAIKGRVTSSIFSELNKNIEFSAKVMDPSIQKMIKDGRINSVSIGAAVKDIDEDEEGFMIPRGIIFKELSLVAVPADSQATFTTALQEAYNHQMKGGLIKSTMKKIKAADSDENVEVETKEESKEEDETETTETVKKLAIAEKRLAVFERKERKALEESYNVLCKSKKADSLDVSELTDKQIKLLMKQLNSLKEEEEVKDESKEESEEKSEDESEEEEESEEENEVEAKYRIVQSHGALRGGSFTYVKN